MDMTITSSAFEHNGPVPKLYTCEGQDISPPLAWSGVPARAKSLALIVDDPDAPDPAATAIAYANVVNSDDIPIINCRKRFTFNML